MSLQGYNTTFEEYVLQRRDQFRRSFLNSGNINTDIIKKWIPIIDQYFGKINIAWELKVNLCLYCEILKSYQDITWSPMSPPRQKFEFELEAELKLVYETIKSKRTRSKIVDKYYNYMTNETEYLLEDGSYVAIEEKVIRPVFEMDYSVLPKELLSVINEGEYRNQKIDDIWLS
jgi:hypothetical protein